MFTPGSQGSITSFAKKSLYKLLNWVFSPPFPKYDTLSVSYTIVIVVSAVGRISHVYVVLHHSRSASTCHHGLLHILSK